MIMSRMARTVTCHQSLWCFHTVLCHIVITVQVSCICWLATAVNKVAFRSKSNHPRMCVFSCGCLTFLHLWPWPWPNYLDVWNGLTSQQQSYWYDLKITNTSRCTLHIWCLTDMYSKTRVSPGTGCHSTKEFRAQQVSSMTWNVKGKERKSIYIALF